MPGKELDDYEGADVIDPEGKMIGQVRAVYISDNADEPEWVTVNTGYFRERDSIVPLLGAQWRDDELVLPMTVDVVNDSPDLASGDEITDSDGETLYEYYGPRLSPVGGDGEGPTVPRHGRSSTGWRRFGADR